jgi:hypothetical protein
MFNTLTDQLAKGPYMLGSTFYAVDVLWGTALAWITHFGTHSGRARDQGLRRARQRATGIRAGTRERHGARRGVSARNSRFVDALVNGRFTLIP